MADKFAIASNSRVTFISNNGVVIGDSELSPDAIESLLITMVTGIRGYRGP